MVVFSGEDDLATKEEVMNLLDRLVRPDDLIVADFSSSTFVDSSISERSWPRTTWPAS